MTVGTIQILEDVPVLGIPSTFAVTTYSDADIPHFQRYFRHWQALRDASVDIDSRIPNLGEAFTEGMFCLWSGSSRYAKTADVTTPFTEKLHHASLDTYNIKKQQSEQIKASIADGAPSSFGPDSKEDALYFMSFYNDGNIDGTFNVYQIPLNVLHSTILNKSRGETFADQCNQRRRPRLSLLTQIIEPLNIQPCGHNIRLW